MRNPQPDLLNSAAAADYVGMSEAWIVLGRRCGYGPDFVRLGNGSGRVFYRIADLDNYLARQTRQAQTVAV